MRQKSAYYRRENKRGAFHSRALFKTRLRLSNPFSFFPKIFFFKRNFPFLNNHRYRQNIKTVFKFLSKYNRDQNSYHPCYELFYTRQFDLDCALIGKPTRTDRNSNAWTSVHHFQFHQKIPIRGSGKPVLNVIFKSKDFSVKHL